MRKSKLRKPVWLLLGYLNLALGILGAVTPLLPTTVFILMAAACFARSHPNMEQRLLQHPVFGKVIRDWRLYRGMQRRTKFLAQGSMLVSFGASIVFSSHLPYIQAILVLLWLGLSIWILHLPTLSANQQFRSTVMPQCTLRKLDSLPEEH
ncbi:YbaN family protein [Vogesella oryzae]|uniref:YbaN family protein n=1 Tax=Vogesella oryzae TaxID=1735285 RepID=UPI0015820071|nr:YbaN family protein [Vogesella oryzae]